MKKKGIIEFKYEKDRKPCWDVTMFPPHQIVNYIAKDDTFILEYSMMSDLSCHDDTPLTPRQQEILDRYSKFIVEHPNGTIIFKGQSSEIGMGISVSKFLTLQSKLRNGKNQNPFTPELKDEI